MTSKTILIQVRMPEKLVRIIDALQDKGIYTSRTEVIMDGVRRLVNAYRTDDPLKLAVIRSLHGKKRTGSFRDIGSNFDPEEIASAITRAFQNDSIDQIIDGARR
jgi:Arc/MetJ-type ribon-helix-helix transcriptional regulator